MIAAVILLGYMILMGMVGAGPAFAEDAAEAAAEETVRIDVTVGPHGMVDGHAESYTQTAAADAEITLALKADEGYVIGSVKVNDTDLAAEDLEGIVGAEEANLQIESSAGALNLAVAFREKGVDVATATDEIAGELGALVTDASQSVTEAVENEADDEASGEVDAGEEEAGEKVVGEEEASDEEALDNEAGSDEASGTEPAGTNVGDEVGSDEVAGADEDGDEVAGTEGSEEDENGESGEDAGDEETDSGEEADDEAGEGSDGTEEETGSGDEKGVAADDAAGADGTSADGTTEAEMASPEVSGNTSSDDASGETAAESTEGNDDAKGSDGSEPNETSDSDAAVQTGDPFSGMPLLLMALSMTMLCILGCRGVWRR